MSQFEIIQNDISTAFCISTKNPNEVILDCISSINLYYNNAVIHIIDSDSSDMQFYQRIKNEFPEIKIHLCKNKNWELGAWKYAVNNIKADNLILLQDGLSFKKYIEFDFEMNDCYIFVGGSPQGFNTCHHDVKYQKGMHYLVDESKYKDICWKNWNNTYQPYKRLIKARREYDQNELKSAEGVGVDIKRFETTMHNAFGIKKRIFENIINDENFIKLPTLKEHSELTERILSLVWKQNQLKVSHIHVNDYKKISRYLP